MSRGYRWLQRTAASLALVVVVLGAGLVWEHLRANREAGGRQSAEVELGALRKRLTAVEDGLDRANERLEDAGQPTVEVTVPSSPTPMPSASPSPSPEPPAAATTVPATSPSPPSRDPPSSSTPTTRPLACVPVVDLCVARGRANGLR